MSGRIGGHLRRNVVGYVALFIALSAGAYAATAPRNSVVSRSIKNGQVKTPDLAANSATGDKVNEASLAGGEITGVNAEIAPGSVGPAELTALPAISVYGDYDHDIATPNTFQDLPFDTVVYVQGISYNLQDMTFTINTAGRYLITATVRFGSFATGSNIGSVRVVVNGVEAGGARGEQFTTPGATATVPLTTILPLNVGDVVKLQITGDNTDVTTFAGVGTGTVNPGAALAMNFLSP